MSHRILVARRFPAAALLTIIITASGLFPSFAHGSPAEDISRAVLAAGAPSVKQADADTFTRAFTSVVIRVKCNGIEPYVTAAVKLRPDLAPQVTVAALKTHRSDAKGVSCECVDFIIRAVVAAAPDAKNAIVRAAIDSEPWARECIQKETAFFRPAGVDAGNINSSAIGTINPANIGGAGQGGVVTPENP